MMLCVVLSYVMFTSFKLPADNIQSHDLKLQTKIELNVMALYMQQ